MCELDLRQEMHYLIIDTLKKLERVRVQLFSAYFFIKPPRGSNFNGIVSV
jgi:hypothetical protein